MKIVPACLAVVVSTLFFGRFDAGAQNPSPKKDTLRVTASAVSLTVEDVPASSRFLTEHFGFREKMAADGFASLVRDDAALNVIFLKRGLAMLPADFRDQKAAGVIIAFTVTNLAGEEARLRQEGVAITLPLREEPWGERLFQVKDPNGVVIELVEWAAPSENKQP